MRKIGIDILQAHVVNLNGCRFDYTEGISDPGEYFNERDGLRIKSFGFNSRVTIQNCAFTSNLTSIHKNVRGLNFEGGSVGSGTNIIVSGNTWDYYSSVSTGIYIIGIFPSNCHVDIFGNTIEIESPQPGPSSYGIKCLNGDKSNFVIIGNTLKSNDDLPYQTGIQMVGSSGMNNEISGNHIPFTTFFKAWLPGVEVQSFDYTRICSNDFYSSNRAFTFRGACDEIIFIDNEVYGHQLINVGGNSWLEDQIHTGNKWNLLDLGSGLGIYQSGLPQAELTEPSFAHLSNFEVHTSQSTDYSGSNFNEYHPVWITPDNNDEWWDQTTGSPATNCLNEGPPRFVTTFKVETADGVIDSILQDSSLEWQAKKQLYKILMNYPDSVSLYSGFSTFLADNSNNPIGLQYKVSSMIDTLLLGDTSLFVIFNGYRNEIDSLSNALILIDSILEVSTSSSQIDSNMNSKSEIIDLIIDLISDMDSTNTIYFNGIIDGLDDIRNLNNSISPRNSWELDENIFYEMYLRFLENRQFTEEENDTLMEIANKCPQEGGRVVYMSRGLLPYCLTRELSDDYEGCYPHFEPELDTLQVRIGRSAVFVNSTNFEPESDFKVFPNPVNNYISLEGVKDKLKSIEIWDNFGKKLIAIEGRNINNRVNVEKLIDGVYYVRFFFTNKSIQTQKFIKIR